MLKKISLAAAIFVFVTVPAFAAPVKDTGDPSERVCNPASYTDLGNGIVRDNVTGLEWVQNGNLMASRDPAFDNDGTAGDGEVAWQTALDYIEKLNDEEYLGYDDWRLPTISELFTLADRSFADGINIAYFPGIPTDLSTLYWSSISYVPDSSSAWILLLPAAVNVASPKANLLYVRPVRGALLTSKNFIDNNDGTITDTNTGLMWQKAADPVTHTTVEQGLLYCQNLELAGYDDWRLPTVNELETLVDYSLIDPATTFPAARSCGFWVSSRTMPMDSPMGLAVDFFSGHFYSPEGPFGPEDTHVRAVRGGPCRSLGDWCIDENDCAGNAECIKGECVPDDPPVIGGGPFLAAGSWPVMPTSPDSAFVLDQNYGVLWTFSDDYAACAGACTHAAEYQIAGDDEWSWTALTVSTDPDGVNYAYVELPVAQLQHRTTYALRFSVTDCTGQTTKSGTYYFRVAFYDIPPAIVDGPFLAAGSWPVLPISSSRAFVLDRNYSVLWTFGDDYASCAGPCTHRARYRKVGETVWTWVPVNTEQRLAWTELPIDTMDNATYQFRFDVRDCAGQITYSKYYYFKDTTPCCEFSTRVASATDDGMERQSNGEIRLCSALNTLTMLDLDLGTDDDTYPNAYSACSRQTMLTAMRFTNVGVPPEIDGVPVTVRNAYIEFTARTNNGNTVFRRAALTLAITAEAADNPVTLGTTAYNISGRPETTASVIWNVPGGSFLDEWDSGQTYTSPDLAPIVQELIGRPGWQSGNAMLFKIDWIDGNGGRTAHSFDSSASMAPRLVIEYEP